MKFTFLLASMLSLFSVCSFAEKKNVSAEKNVSRYVYSVTLTSDGIAADFYLNGFKIGGSTSNNYYQSQARVGEVLRPSDNLIEVKLPLSFLEKARVDQQQQGVQYGVVFERNEVDGDDNVVGTVSTTIINYGANTADANANGLVTKKVVEQAVGRADLALWNRTEAVKDLTDADRQVITGLVNALGLALYSGSAADFSEIMSVRYQDQSRAVGLKDDELLNIALSQFVRFRKQYTFRKPVLVTSKDLVFTPLDNEHVWHVKDLSGRNSDGFAVVIQIGDSPAEQLAIDTFFAKVDGKWTVIR